MAFIIFFLSLIPILIFYKKNQDFFLISSFYLINWIGSSLSVFLASAFSLDLVEIGVSAEESFAPFILNLTIFSTLFISCFFYNVINLYEIKISHRVIKSNFFNSFDKVTFFGLVIFCLIIIVFSFDMGIPLLLGKPISIFLAEANKLEKFSFAAIAISALPLSKMAHFYFISKKINFSLAILLSLIPALVWALAGEKMGYMFFILYTSMIPWLGKSLRSVTFYRLFALSVLVVLIGLTFIQFALSSEDAFEQTILRFAMQGQLWFYFFKNAADFVSFNDCLAIISGENIHDTIHLMMFEAMPTGIFQDYVSATMTAGSHFPALLFAFGWYGFPFSIILFSIVFSISLTMLRIANEIDSYLISFLIVACFVFPGVEVWVSGNISRLINIPMTFKIFYLLLLLVSLPVLRLVKK